MKKTFISFLTDFINTNGKKILDQPDHFKSLFLDFSQNEYRAEAQIFSQFLASPQAQELKNSDDVDTGFLKAITERFQKAYLFEKSTCEMAVTAYAWLLGLIDQKTFEAGIGRGSAGKTSNAAEQNTQAPENTPLPVQAVTRPKITRRQRNLIMATILMAIAAVLIAVGPRLVSKSKSAENTVIQPAPAYIVNMIRIEGGTFLMGSPADEQGRLDNEGPQHQVTVSSFYIGKYPVTVNGNDIAIHASWYTAIEYCNELSEQEKLTPAYTINTSWTDQNNQNKDDKILWTVTWNRNANGYRLPTEAEWEYACRAGTTTAYNTGSRITSSQAKITSFLRITRNGITSSGYSVGSFMPNSWGLYDMHGGVREWCWDWYGTYQREVQINPQGVVSGTDRVIRGWLKIDPQDITSSTDRQTRLLLSINPEGDLRSAVRSYAPPFSDDHTIGFRLVRNVE